MLAGFGLHRDCQLSDRVLDGYLSCIRYVLEFIVMFSGNALAGSHWLHRLSDVLADGLVCCLPRTHTIEASQPPASTDKCRKGH